MAEQKESSVLFSLKELMNLEEDRIRQEDDEKKKRAEAEVQARTEAEKRAREQEQARLHAEEEFTRNRGHSQPEEVANLGAGNQHRNPVREPDDDRPGDETNRRTHAGYTEQHEDDGQHDQEFGPKDLRKHEPV